LRSFHGWASKAFPARTCAGGFKLLLAASLLGPFGCSDDDGDETTIVVIPAEGSAFTMTIAGVKIGGDRKPVVDFTLADDAGTPLPVSELDGSPRFVLGHIVLDPASGLSRYESDLLSDVEGSPYTLNGVQQQPALPSATQAITDSGGVFTELKPGSHRYTFGLPLAEGYDRGATHTVAAFATRGDGEVVQNPVFDFVPAGGTATDPREVISTEACNACHHPLEAHGGSRREVRLCIICHTSQTIDPETGNSLDFAVLVHKIHTGVDLANQPYFVVGRNQNIDDYSTVVFPQDLRNCTNCHRDAPDADNWRSKPSRQACGSCHDDVNFQTGQGHSDGIQQFDDTLCTRCHRDALVVEFDNTVPGAHTIPIQSTVNPGLALAITGVENMTPGNQPRVRFTIADEAGPVAIATLNRVGIVFGGPATDYSQLVSQSHIFTVQGSGATPGLTTNATGDYTYAPAGYEIPDNATGTWSVGLEARTNDLPAGEGTARFPANNPIAHVDLAAGTLGGGAPAARRIVVTNEKCDACHDDLRFHGDQRTDVQYCIICHNRLSTDEGDRPDVDPVTNPPATIDFKVLIHKIHRGQDLENPFTVYGFNATPHDYTQIRFPGDLRNCSACHEEDTQLLPLPSALGPTVINIAGAPVPGDKAVFPPTTAVCTSCHDGDSTLTHARLNTLSPAPGVFEEACDVCHGEGSAEAVSEVHAAD
jgi:OmcA/MtrC family decaheme c-type cytochrome